jgi:type II secretion system protein I
MFLSLSHLGSARVASGGFAALRGIQSFARSATILAATPFKKWCFARADGFPRRPAEPPRAFTLVEVLAAMAIMAILVPVLVSAVATSNRAALVAERGSTATQLAESKLNELLVEGTWSSGAGSGDFGNDYPNYRWELQNGTWTENSSMTELTMTVYYSVQAQEHTVELTTLVAQSQ